MVGYVRRERSSAYTRTYWATVLHRHRVFFGCAARCEARCPTFCSTLLPSFFRKGNRRTSWPENTRHNPINTRQRGMRHDRESPRVSIALLTVKKAHCLKRYPVTPCSTVLTIRSIMPFTRPGKHRRVWHTLLSFRRRPHIGMFGQFHEWLFGIVNDNCGEFFSSSCICSCAALAETHRMCVNCWCKVHIVGHFNRSIVNSIIAACPIAVRQRPSATKHPRWLPPGVTTHQRVASKDTPTNRNELKRIRNRLAQSKNHRDYLPPIKTLPFSFGKHTH